MTLAGIGPTADAVADAAASARRMHRTSGAKRARSDGRMAAAPSPAGILLSTDAMARWWQATLLVGVTGCGLVHEPPVVTTPASLEQGLPESDLSHPRTIAWTRRFCAKMATRPAAALGLVPSQ